MSVRKPKPGTVLDDGYNNTAIVIERGWTDERIRESAREWDDSWEFEYDLESWRYCTRRWRDSEGVDGIYDTWWNPSGDGATTIEVAAIR